MPTPILLASSNEGKLREYRELAVGTSIEIGVVPNFEKIPEFEETAPTFAENSAGKAMYYSRFARGTVLSDDSGLVVPALGGAPGVQSARYAGPNAAAADRIAKLLHEMRNLAGDDRRARFVCITSLARRGNVIAVVSDSVEGIIAEEPHGTAGFGYDPVFLVPGLGQTFGESTAAEKHQFSHRARAFRKIIEFFQRAAA